jgi:hypothetical protein
MKANLDTEIDSLADELEIDRRQVALGRDREALCEIESRY